MSEDLSDTRGLVMSEDLSDTRRLVMSEDISDTRGCEEVKARDIQTISCT